MGLEADGDPWGWKWGWVCGGGGGSLDESQGVSLFFVARQCALVVVGGAGVGRVADTVGVVGEVVGGDGGQGG